VRVCVCLCVAQTTKPKPNQITHTAQSDTKMKLNTNTNSNQKTTKNPKPTPKSKIQMVSCHTAFCDDVPITDAIALACGHFFCHDCWRGYLNSEFNVGNICIFSSCPGMRYVPYSFVVVFCACPFINSVMSYNISVDVRRTIVMPLDVVANKWCHRVCSRSFWRRKILLNIYGASTCTHTKRYIHAYTHTHTYTHTRTVTHIENTIQ